MKRIIAVFITALSGAMIIIFALTGANTVKENDFIKYAEFNITYPALEKAMNIDIDSQSEKIKISWIDILSYLGAKYGGDFSKYKSSDMDEITEKIKNGEKIENLTKDMKYYSYYHEVYSAVLGGFLGKYTETTKDENSKEQTNEKYGLKVYSPVAETFPFSHYDDFGASRTYGYARNHLGHDLMAATGTPII